jgi:hypothetical protein
VTARRVKRAYDRGYRDGSTPPHVPRGSNPPPPRPNCVANPNMRDDEVRAGRKHLDDLADYIANRIDSPSEPVT